MAKPRLKATQQRFENQYLDVSLPNLESFKFTLNQTTTTWQDVKTDEIIKVDNDFHILFDTTGVLNSEDRELSKRVQEATKLNFAPYSWKEKTYKFYTTERTGTEEEKKEILKNLFDIFKNYEVERKVHIKDSLEVFQQDSREKIKMSTPELLMKFNESVNKFVVVAVDFLGSEKFSILRRSSEYMGKLCQPNEILPNNMNKYALSVDFFKEDLPNKKLDNKSYFFINPANYEHVKMLFISEEKKLQKFIEEQKAISKTQDLSQYNIEEENEFGLKIKFDAQNQCFEFYGKGYFEPETGYGYTSSYYTKNRSLLGTWALNFIYSKPRDEQSEGSYHSEIMSGEKEKIELEFIKGGTKREKNMRVPASEWKKIKLIKDNYETQKIFWQRPEKSIKITDCDFDVGSIIERFPAIYFDAKGSPFFIRGSRRTGIFKSIGMQAMSSTNANAALGILDDFDDVVSPAPVSTSVTDVVEKKKKEPKFAITLKAIPITFEEAINFMENHEFADKIKSNTIRLNANAWNKQNEYLDKEKQQEIFDTVFLHAKLQSENKVQGTKTKRLKI